MPWNEIGWKNRQKTSFRKWVFSAVLVSWKQPHDLPTRCFTPFSVPCALGFLPEKPTLDLPTFSFILRYSLMYSRDMKPTSKTSIQTQVPGRDFWNTENNREPRNGGDCTMDNNLRGLRSNSTIVIQNIIGKMQLGRQTFRIKSN